MGSQIMLFKVLVDGKPCHGGAGEYVPGEWTKPVSPHVCNSGWHLTSDPLRWWVPRAELWLAEDTGEIDGQGDDKAAFTSVRIMERITRYWRYLPMFPRIRAFLAASERSLDQSADIAWSNLSGANLSEANLSWAYLPGADLSEANLSGADLSWANLSGANLSRADLSLANLSWANLSGADLSGADLSGADLSRADLSLADLSGADLSRANLSRAYRPTNAPVGWAADSDGRLYRKDQAWKRWTCSELRWRLP